jgi:hypothetical protein
VVDDLRGCRGDDVLRHVAHDYASLEKQRLKACPARTFYVSGKLSVAEVAVPVPQGEGSREGDDSRIVDQNEFKLVCAGRSNGFVATTEWLRRGWASEQCARNGTSGGDTVVSSGASFLCENVKVRNLRGRYSVSSEADFLSHREVQRAPVRRG